MNQTLEAMARAIFKSWFVDFDPVRAKAEGRDPGLSAPRRLFPARLVDSELGEIPEGWEVGTLGDVAQHPRRAVQPHEIEPDTPYIALEHMPKRCIALLDWGSSTGLESNKFEFKRGEILFGKLRPYLHKVGVAPVDGVCSTDIVVVRPISKAWSGSCSVTYPALSSSSTRTPARQARRCRERVGLTWLGTELALPPEPVASAFSSLVLPSIERIIACIHESRTIAALRDTVLPNLISGELRVKYGGRFGIEVIA